MAYTLNTGHALYPNLIELIGVDAGALVSLKTARTFTPDSGSAFGSGTWGAHFATAGGGFTRKGAAFTDLIINTITNPNLTVVAVLNAVSTAGGGGKMQLVSSTATSAPSFGFVAGPKVTSLENYSTLAVTGTTNLTGANMLTLTRTGETSHSVYINSAVEFSGAKAGFASSETTYNSIGGVAGQGSVAANIVWLAWFDKVLTPTEVSDLYASLGAANAFGLVSSGPPPITIAGSGSALPYGIAALITSIALAASGSAAPSGSAALAGAAGAVIAASNSAITSSSTVLTAGSGTLTVADAMKNNTGTLLASQSGVRVSVLRSSDFVAVYQQTGLATNASALLAAINNGAIVSGQSYHIAIKLADGSVGITGPIVAS